MRYKFNSTADKLFDLLPAFYYVSSLKDFSDNFEQILPNNPLHLPFFNGTCVDCTSSIIYDGILNGGVVLSDMTDSVRVFRYAKYKALDNQGIETLDAGTRLYRPSFFVDVNRDVILADFNLQGPPTKVSRKREKLNLVNLAFR